ncbi:hypothetical protein MUP38_05425 [Candidatus Bathyarchaeota archaeon]|nr:hypothetical protein [Candidatus Bathyarchaeota archaeon]
MENCEKPVQNNKKKLSRSNKVGRHKYNQQLLKRAQKDIEEIKLTQRTILSGLKDFFHFKQPIIEKIACLDEVDREILQVLFEVGSPGVLPKDLATRLARFSVSRHQISQRILRINKRLEKEMGEHVAEKRGWCWALTSFAAEVWGETA